MQTIEKLRRVKQFFCAIIPVIYRTTCYTFFNEMYFNIKCYIYSRGCFKVYNVYEILIGVVLKEVARQLLGDTIIRHKKGCNFSHIGAVPPVSRWKASMLDRKEKTTRVKTFVICVITEIVNKKRRVNVNKSKPKVKEHNFFWCQTRKNKN